MHLNVLVPYRLISIAPVLAAKIFNGVELTVGLETEGSEKWPYAGTAQAINAMGGKHVNRDVSISFCVDTLYHFGCSL